MLVCAKCGSVLQCIKTDMYVWVDRFTVYKGDLFQCPECGFKVAHANNNNNRVDPVVTPIEEHDIIHWQARNDMTKAGG